MTMRADGKKKIEKALRDNAVSHLMPAPFLVFFLPTGAHVEACIAGPDRLR